MKYLVKIGKAVLIAAIWIGLWWGASALTAKPLLFPSPLAVAKELIRLAGTSQYWLAVLRSLAGVLLGVASAILLAVPLALATSRVGFLRSFLQPLMAVVKATPVASFIILALIFLGAAILPAFSAFLIVFPIVWTNLDEGLRKIDAQLTEVAAVFRMPFGKRLRYLIFPSVKPYFLSACRSSVGLGWKAGIAAEVIAMPLGAIGTMIGEAKQYIRSTEVFALTLTVILFSILIDAGLSALAHFLDKREKGGRDHVEI